MFNAAKSTNAIRQNIVQLFKSLWIRKSSAFSRNTAEKPWRVIFYGTDEFSLFTLKAMNASRLTSDSKIIDALEIVCIKSDCAVRTYAEKNNLTIHAWPYDLPSGIYDVGVVVSFGHMIPTDSILACKFGILNAHPSLLPRWRGAAPLIHTILNGDLETGVTITEVSPNKFDIGKIILQEKYKIPKDYSLKQLSKDLGEMASEMVLNTLKGLPNILKTSYPQAKEGVKYARKIKPEQGCIIWEEETALQIYRKYKAFDGLFDIYSFWKGVKVTIMQILPPEDAENAQISRLVEQGLPGYCYYHKKRRNLFVKCKDGWCGLTSVKIPTRGKISALDFYNGFISKVDSNQAYFSVK
ncbi:methionyl-tRNA formyltransferase, mitochondrial-like [Uloborus diversus]|uniref:methionyl-tRNA formyltransferase, mitochondrial-like n=1 Tax=Uloborus diversus TaxID=327109 RepID=UPI00240A09AF|nr:methionyl-tRNA formyltransferase, mitochondrial-like [Uloborus diversus]